MSQIEFKFCFITMSDAKLRRNSRKKRWIHTGNEKDKHSRRRYHWSKSVFLIHVAFASSVHKMLVA